MANIGSGTFVRLVHGNNFYVAVARDNYATTSTDCKTWSSQRTIGQAAYTNDVAFGNGVFVVPSNDGNVYRSANGLNWDGPSNRPDGYTNLTCITYDGSRFVIVSGVGTTFSTTDGVTLSKAGNVDGSHSIGATDVIYYKGLYVITCDNGTIWHSTNYAGTSAAWTNVKLQSMALNRLRIINDTLFVAANSNIYYSTDGKTYTRATTTSMFNCYDINYIQNSFIAVGAGGKGAKSLDGKIWDEPIDLQLNSNLRGVIAVPVLS